MQSAVRLGVSALGFTLLMAGVPAFACSFGNWSQSSGSQGLSAGGPSDGLRRFEGECGLRVSVGSSPRFLQDDSPGAESAYLARFYVFADELELSGNGSVEVFTAYRGSGGSSPEFGVRLENDDGTLALVGRARDGGGFDESSRIALSPGWRAIEVQWTQATGPNNGRLTLYVDGVQRTELSGLANRDGAVDSVRLGAVETSGAGGTLDFDAFVSHRDTPIGELTAGDANADESLDAEDIVALVREINGQSLAAGQPDCNRDGAVDQGDLNCVANAIVQR